MAQTATNFSSKAASAVATKLPAKQAVWKWSGKTRQGEQRSGTIEATDAAAARSRLQQMGIEQASVKRSLGAIEIKLPGVGGVTTKDLLIFTRQFSVMIDAGLPLVQALDIIGTQADNPAFKKVLLAVKAKVESGSTFADALADHPKVFDSLFVELVRAGEIGGILDTILTRLGAYIEKNEKLKRRVKGAMVYPAIVLTVAVGVTVILLTYVTPTFEKMFKDFGGELPGPTQTVINVSHWMQHSLGYIVVALVLMGIAWTQARRRSPRFRYQTDALFLRLPVFGPLLRKVAVARFSRTFSTMLSSGVPILDALDICGKTSGNKVIEAGLQRTRAAISEGKTIAEPLRAVGVFPNMVVQMIAVGEQTGSMDAMLAKLADFYDDEVDAAVAGLTSLLEPIMMVFLGGTIGTILIAMYLPIFKIADAVK
jgi:type IV pilus assembly protein PilC